MSSESEHKTPGRTGLGDVLGYFFRKPGAGRPNSFNLRAMHTINKISMVMFLIGLIFLIVKLATR